MSDADWAVIANNLAKHPEVFLIFGGVVLAWAIGFWRNPIQTGWRLYQCLIVIAVGWTGIYYKWTDAPIVLGLLGIGVAWLLSVPPLKLFLWLLGLRGIPSEKRADG